MSIKKLFVLGCSFSTGEETCDYELIENYNNYRTDPKWMFRLDSNEQTSGFWEEKTRLHSDHMIDMYDNRIPEWAKRPDVDEWINETIKKEGRLFHDADTRRDYKSYWVNYSDKNAYSRILNDSTDYEVINGSRRGTGIIYQHLIYNMHRQIKVNNEQGFFWSSPGLWPNSYAPEKQFQGGWMQEAYYPCLGTRNQWRYNEINYHDRLPDPTFRYDEAIDNSDVLVWQFTGEPRYALTLRDRMDIPIGSSLQTLFSWIDNQKFTSNDKQPATYLPGRKQIKEWYKYYHDPACDMAKAVGWMENVIKLREAKGLKTIMMCITPQFSKRFGIEPRNNEHTVSLGFNFDHKLSDQTIIDFNIRSAPKPDPNIEYGLAYQGFKEIKFDQGKYLAKWGHLSSEGHILVADKIKEQLEKWK